MDGTNFEQIRNIKNVDGYTFNPSLFKKLGAKDYISFAKSILSEIKEKPVSIEVFADDENECLKQALIISELGKNVYVKIPVTNSKGKFSGKAISYLSKRNVKLNITAVYTVAQVRKILKKINKKSKTIISIFAGRMSDVGKDPLPIIKESVRLTKKLKKVDILWASTREAYNYTQAKNCGCSIITMPPSIINKIGKFGASFQNLTLKTVKTFLKDSQDSNFKI